ncbi:SusC/RagA family TonB-linked outer membrane protein [Flavisolibacter nicotianae]|uniref:SusC/RagA family TonB-linked outer membrane protein n=1 Tax=Flavisolibacter nicotianae TaxID=2364882 RepID=UPI000EB54F72|nr:TonB-dependent receptor [Flavisolibacter nicotianae]
MLEKLTAPRLWFALFFLFFSSLVFAQQKRVTGKVTGEDGKPVAGATVTARGTSVSTQTTDDGTFSFNVPQNTSRLVVTSVGYDPQEIAVGSGDVSVSLRSNAASMNEVVVTTGYVTQRKKEVTGSVAVVNVTQLKQQPTGTFAEALQGKASGVQIISSGQPGAGTDIRIRGITGFGNNQPLVIVDGVRGNLNDINPNDVESVQVLKDAAAAIYGVAGSNGVLIVTTRKGRSGKARVSYDAYYGVATQGKGYDLASTQEEANAIWQQMLNSGLKPGDVNWGNKQFGNGATPVIPDYITPTGYTGSDPSKIDPSLYDKNSYQITRANKIGTNWYKEITRNAPTQSHNISVSSGTDKSSYFFSMNYLDQQGIAKFQYLKRYSVRANTQFNVNNHIRLGENAYIFYRQNPRFGNQGEGSPFSMALREDPIIPVYDIMGNFAGTKSQGLGNAQNVYANVYRTKDNRGNQWDFSGNVFAEVDFLKNFTVRTTFGGVMDNQYYYNFNYVGYENAEGNTGTNSFSEGAQYNTQWTFNNTLTYSKIFATNHNVRVLLGTEAVQYKGRGLGATRSNYFSENPNFWTIDAGAASPANSGYAYQSALWSQFASVDYGFKGKYLLHGSIRRDGASQFVGSKRFAYFPAGSAAWRISQEDFMKGVSFFNDLKLRYSWGKLGNAANVSSTNPYNLYASRSGFSFYDIGGTSTAPAPGFYQSNIGNTNTTFEGDIISNIGIDATILRNKLDLSIDYYKKAVSGLLFRASGPQYQVVYTGGAGLPQVNIGDMQNTGIDANVTYHGAIKRDFKFDVTATFTSYNNKIKSIPGANYFDPGAIRNVTITRNQVGHAVGEFYGYKVLGLFQSADEVAKAPTQNGAEPGVFRYADIDGNGKIDQNDRTFIGNPNPDFTYGLNISFNYKAFDFSTFFFGSQGNDIFNQTLYYTDFPDFFKGAIRREAALNAWTPTNTSTNIPKLLNAGTFSTDAVTSSYFVSNGSYLRNKQMQLGYTLPNSLLSRYGIERFRIYVQSANMFTITKYKGLDPELSSPDPNARTPLFGIDQGNYPHTPYYLVGVNLNF